MLGVDRTAEPDQELVVPLDQLVRCVAGSVCVEFPAAGAEFWVGSESPACLAVSAGVGSLSGLAWSSGVTASENSESSTAVLSSTSLRFSKADSLRGSCPHRIRTRVCAARRSRTNQGDRQGIA